MLERLSLAVIKSGAAQADDIEIIKTGLSQIFIYVVGFIATLCIGFAFGKPLQSVLYLLTFMPIRIFAGGYHAKTVTRCVVISTAILLCAIVALRFLQIGVGISILIIFISATVILILAPQDVESNRLREIEKAVFGRTAKILTLCVSLIALATTLANGKVWGDCITFALFTEALLLVWGAASNHQARKQTACGTAGVQE